MNKRPHILVVDDEPHLAVGIRYNLEAAGYRVTTAADGPKALKAFESEPEGFDLLILDLMLPGMSGYAVCESLRAAGSTVPVLILSARTLSEDRTRGFDVGANQYLTKPFELDELLSRVRNLLTHYPRVPAGAAAAPATKSDVASIPPAAPEIYRFANVEVNFTTFEVRVASELVSLTSLEMKLLRYFIENEGRLIPRTELLEKVWNMPSFMNTRAPDQFIRRLRKLFEPNPAEPQYFLTLRDAGYRFIASGKPAT
ncbi:MAG: response regulator transcription factor [Pirellulales bacterium]